MRYLIYGDFVALRRLRASNQIEEDVQEMQAEERAQSTEAAISMVELICSPTLRYPLMIGVIMQLSQQLSGINAVSDFLNSRKLRRLEQIFEEMFAQVLYYSTGLFQKAGLPEEIAKFMTIGIGVIMVAMTLITMPLMDRMGRRTLHLYGLGGMFIFSVFITISFLTKVSIEMELAGVKDGE